MRKAQTNKELERFYLDLTTNYPWLSFLVLFSIPEKHHSFIVCQDPLHAFCSACAVRCFQFHEFFHQLKIFTTCLDALVNFCKFPQISSTGLSYLRIFYFLVSDLTLDLDSKNVFRNRYIYTAFGCSPSIWVDTSDSLTIIFEDPSYVSLAVTIIQRQIQWKKSIFYDTHGIITFDFSS